MYGICGTTYSNVTRGIASLDDPFYIFYNSEHADLDPSLRHDRCPKCPDWNYCDTCETESNKNYVALCQELENKEHIKIININLDY